MVKISKDNIVHIKILYWGRAGSGKTTILNSLYKLTKEDRKDITPTSEITKVDRASGATLYFDSCIFQSTEQNQVLFHVFTVAGQRTFSVLRKRLFAGTDGIIFVVDSQTQLFEDNNESLKELKTFAGNKLINQIPIVFMLNKQDLDDVISKEDLIPILKEEKLWHEPGHQLASWNPSIYETCGLFDTQKNVYRSFYDCARRVALFHIYGLKGAPAEKKDSKFPIFS
jgi:hypothetical protein